MNVTDLKPLSSNLTVERGYLFYTTRWLENTIESNAHRNGRIE